MSAKATKRNLIAAGIFACAVTVAGVSVGSGATSADDGNNGVIPRSQAEWNELAADYGYRDASGSEERALDGFLIECLEERDIPVRPSADGFEFDGDPSVITECLVELDAMAREDS